MNIDVFPFICIFFNLFMSVLSFQYTSFLLLWLSLFLSVLFILFVAIVNGIVLLISFLDSSFLLCSNAANFCMLILYPATSLMLFISSDSLFVESLWFSTYDQAICKQWSFYFLPSNVYAFISFYCLIALSGISSTRLNISDKKECTEHPCLYQILVEKILVFLYWL